MTRRLSLALVPMLAGLLGGCGMDAVSGKTTTTGNGGGLVALGPEGLAAGGCLVLAARSWDSAAGRPGTVDTLRTDAQGVVHLPAEQYAFVEVRDEVHSLGAWVRRIALAGNERQVLTLDSLRAVRGTWGGQGGASGGRMFLDSTFQASDLGSDGSFAFAEVPVGAWTLRVDVGGTARALGLLRVDSAALRLEGSDSVTVAVDTAAAPQWIDDFESGSNVPRLHAVLPGVSPWYMWWIETAMVLPATNDGDSIAKAIDVDSARAGSSFHARFTPQGTSSWVALGLTGMELDWSARQELCFGYRSDTALKVQLQRDSVGSIRPTFSAWAPASTGWHDVCLPFAGFVPNSDVPDSLTTWAAFGKRVLVIEFQAQGGTFLDLDDILVR